MNILVFNCLKIGGRSGGQVTSSSDATLQQINGVYLTFDQSTTNFVEAAFEPRVFKNILNSLEEHIENIPSKISKSEFRKRGQFFGNISDVIDATLFHAKNNQNNYTSAQLGKLRSLKSRLKRFRKTRKTKGKKFKRKLKGMKKFVSSSSNSF